MAKGSVRKKGKKWYYRFYVEGAVIENRSISRQSVDVRNRRWTSGCTVLLTASKKLFRWSKTSPSQMATVLYSHSIGGELLG